MKINTKRNLYMVFVFFLLSSVFGIICSMESYGDPAYISFYKGAIYARSSNQDEFGFVEINVPLEPGDELVSAEESFAEIMLANGIVMWMNSETFLRADKDSDMPGVEILDGAVFIRNNADINDDVSCLVKTSSATIQSLHNSFVNVSLNEIGEVTVEVWEGNAVIYFENEEVSVREGKKAFIGTGGNYFSSTYLEQRASSEFVEWSLEQDKRLQDNTSLPYLEENLAGSSYLSDYGEWLYNSSFSSYVWIPRVSYTWRPYLNGRWFCHPQGYYWVSYEPWGWVPHHYGKWVRNRNNQWCWIPGYSFSNAWVEFVSFGRYYGWAPIGYGYHPHYYSYNPGSIHNYTHSFIIESDAFSFADKDCFHSAKENHDGEKDILRPLTDDDIIQHENITLISQPERPLTEGRTRFHIPVINENFPGTFIKNLEERLRNNFPAEYIQTPRAENMRFLDRNNIRRFTSIKRIRPPLKHSNSPEKIIKRELLKEGVLKKKKFVSKRGVRRDNAVSVKLPKEGKRLPTIDRKKKLVHTHNTILNEGPIVSRHGINMKRSNRN